VEELMASPSITPAALETRLDDAVPAPVRVESSRTIEIQRFVPREQIDPRYHDSPYYIVPRDQVGQDAFAVIRDAMASKRVVGLAHVTLAKRERPIIIAPMGKGLCGITLRYAHEVRNASDYFADISETELPDEMLRVAEHIVDVKKGDFDLVFLEDRYRSVLVSVLKEKQAAQLPQTIAPARPAENVIDLMDVLKRSLAAERPEQTSARKPSAAPSTLKPTARRAVAAPTRAPVRRSKVRTRKSR
jgi:Ku protein